MKNENQDLLNLCRLNQMEDGDPVDELKGPIDFKKRQLTSKIVANRPKASDEVLQEHIKRNTYDGVYPWTESELFGTEIEPE